jgi:cell division septation protein DedD
MLLLTAAMIFAGLAVSRAETRLAQADTPAATPPATTSPATAPPATTPPEAAKPQDDKPADTSKAAPASPTAAPAKEAVYPSAIDPKFSHELGLVARMRTCAAQFDANKATDSNGGMKWIDRHGGYYLECSRRLKVHG